MRDSFVCATRALSGQSVHQRCFHALLLSEEIMQAMSQRTPVMAASMAVGASTLDARRETSARRAEYLLLDTRRRQAGRPPRVAQTCCSSAALEYYFVAFARARRTAATSLLSPRTTPLRRELRFRDTDFILFGACVLVELHGIKRLQSAGGEDPLGVSNFE